MQLRTRELVVGLGLLSVVTFYMLNMQSYVVKIGNVEVTDGRFIQEGDYLRTDSQYARNRFVLLDNRTMKEITLKFQVIGDSKSLDDDEDSIIRHDVVIRPHHQNGCNLYHIAWGHDHNNNNYYLSGTIKENIGLTEYNCGGKGYRPINNDDWGISINTFRDSKWHEFKVIEIEQCKFNTYIDGMLWKTYYDKNLTFPEGKLALRIDNLDIRFNLIVVPKGG